MARNGGTPTQGGGLINLEFGPALPVQQVPQSYVWTQQNINAIYRDLIAINQALASPTLLSAAQLAEISKALNNGNAAGATLPGVRGTTIVDTAANMASYAPASYAVGTTYFQSDRKVTYIVASVSGSLKWVYDTGVYAATLGLRPSTLGTNDSGYLFYATDQGRQYRWTGGVWSVIGTIGVIIVDTHAARSGYSPSDYPVGTQYFESDRTVLYRNDGTSWLYTTGTMRDTFANRPSDLGSNDVGFDFYSTNTFLGFYWDGSVWVPILAVTSLNGLLQNITIVGGNNITVTQNNNTGVITISSP